MSQTTDIELAGSADAAQLTKVIAAAFFPLAPCQWLIPHPIQRRRTLPDYFRILVDHALAHGIVETTADRKAVALWLPIGAGGPEAPEDYDERLKAAVGPHLERFEILDKQFEAHHLTGIAHHHLAILAVHPDQQGQGLGRSLLTAHHRILDARGTPAYLEASDEDNRLWYQRHGYSDVGTPIRLPDGPLMFPMMRPPHHE